MNNHKERNFLRLKSVLVRIGFSKSKWYAMIKAGQAPAPQKVGCMSLWRSEDIDAFISNLGNGGAV